MFCADETALYWKNMPSKNFRAREKSMPGLQSLKEQADSCRDHTLYDFKVESKLTYCF